MLSSGVGPIKKQEVAGSSPEVTGGFFFFFLSFFLSFFFFWLLAFKKANHSKGSKQFSKLKLSLKIQNYSRSSILLGATAKYLIEVA